MRRLVFLVGLCALAVVAAGPSVAGARGLPQGAAAPSPPPNLKAPRHLTTRLDWRPPHHISTKAALRVAAAGTSVQMWTRGQATGGTTYHYTMVGRNPFVAEKYPNTTIKTYVLALDIQNDSDDFSAYADDPCDANVSAQTRLLASPILKNKAYTWGGTSISPVGTQITDAFQRAEFWKYTNPSGVNPNYHVKLGFNPSTQLIHLTYTYKSIQPEITGGCDPLLEQGIKNWDSFVQTTLFPQLEANYGINPTDFVVFLLKNTVFYQGNTSNCCILGYHNAFGSPVQTYAVADYDTSGFFSGAPDISVMSHEVAEWMDDPLTTNPTPAWGNIGQVVGCQSNLEVGDPLTGTTYPVKLNGFTYHPQELAFFSWFYDQHPSIGVNGWYSDQDTFTTYAAPCS